MFPQGTTKLREGFDKSKRHLMHTPMGKRLTLERSLRPTQATLVVVPMALLEHWYEQFKRHVEPRKLAPEALREEASTGQGVIWFDGWGDLVSVRQPLTEPKIEGHRPSLTAAQMADHMVIVTTMERCQLEYDHERSPYRDLRWLRLIVDEGHELGGGRHHATDDDHKFIAELAAERRWVMTGTPTVGSDPRGQLAQLQNLLRFLRHPQYGVPGEEAESAWEEVVESYMDGGGEESHATVLELLQGGMVRHTKSQLQLKEPEFRDVSRVLPREAPLEHGGVFATYRENYEKEIQHKKQAKKLLLGHPSEAYSKWEAAQAAEVWQDLYDARDGYHKALHIIEVMAEFGPRTKALVFAENWADLNYTAHWLTVLKGDDAVAQHHGRLRSAALQAFRYDRKHVVRCPTCGHEEEVTGVKKPRCSRTFLLVKYNDHLLGSPTVGVTAGQVDHYDKGPHNNFTAAQVPPGRLILPEDRVKGLILGRKWNYGPNGDVVDLVAAPKEAGIPPSPAGRATVLGFGRCAGFHGGSLEGLPTIKKPIKCNAMLLEKDGSHGLDLPFTTHIFLLPSRFGRSENTAATWAPIRDPAMINQVVARAHRIGHATVDDDRDPVVVESIAFHHDEAKKTQAEARRQAVGDIGDLYRKSFLNLPHAEEEASASEEILHGVGVGDAIEVMFDEEWFSGTVIKVGYEGAKLQLGVQYEDGTSEEDVVYPDPAGAVRFPPIPPAPPVIEL